VTALNIDYISNYRDNVGYGVGLFFATFLVAFLTRMTISHMFYRFTILGINLANTVTMMVFTKSLRYSSMADKEFTEGEIINYSQVDA
jgi:hypothetical protein